MHHQERPPRRLTEDENSRIKKLIGLYKGDTMHLNGLKIKKQSFSVGSHWVWYDDSRTAGDIAVISEPEVDTFYELNDDD